MCSGIHCIWFFSVFGGEEESWFGRTRLRFCEMTQAGSDFIVVHSKLEIITIVKERGKSIQNRNAGQQLGNVFMRKKIIGSDIEVTTTLVSPQFSSECPELLDCVVWKEHDKVGRIPLFPSILIDCLILFMSSWVSTLVLGAGTDSSGK